MMGLGWQELLIVLIIVVIVFGAGKLPQVGGALGRSIKEFKAEAGSEPDLVPTAGRDGGGAAEPRRLRADQV